MTTVLRKFKKPKCNYEVNTNHFIKTDCSEIRKISGTSLGALMGVSPYLSRFGACCKLLGLCDEDLSDKPAIKTGIALESVIIDYIGKAHADIGDFIPAKDVFGEKVGGHEDWASDFHDETGHYVGHCDGFVSIDGEDYILEVKTAKNLDGWTEHVPEHYYWQVALYNAFMCRKDKAFVLLGIVTDETYKDPASWVPNDENCLLFQIDMDVEAIDQKLAEVAQYYDNYIKKGITCQWDETNRNDMEIVNHLIAIGLPADTLSLMVDELGTLEAEIDEHDAQIIDKRNRAEELKKAIRDAMTTAGKSDIVSSSKLYACSISESRTTKWNEAQMKKDGIDADKYKTVSITKRFTIKNNKE